MKKSQAIAAISRCIDAARSQGAQECIKDPSKRVGWDEALRRMYELRNLMNEVTEKEFAEFSNRGGEANRKAYQLF
jgi:hypothetical protein